MTYICGPEIICIFLEFVLGSNGTLDISHTSVNSPMLVAVSVLSRKTSLFIPQTLCIIEVLILSGRGLTFFVRIFPAYPTSVSVIPLCLPYHPWSTSVLLSTDLQRTFQHSPNTWEGILCAIETLHLILSGTRLIILEIIYLHCLGTLYGQHLLKAHTVLQ